MFYCYYYHPVMNVKRKVQKKNEYIKQCPLYRTGIPDTFIDKPWRSGPGRVFQPTLLTVEASTPMSNMLLFHICGGSVLGSNKRAVFDE